jgi:cell division protein FtsW (lipid II flippase)
MMKRQRRLMWALSGYVVIAIVAFKTLPDKFYVERFGYLPMSAPVILLMALLAFKSILHRDETLGGSDGDGDQG